MTFESERPLVLLVDDLPENLLALKVVLKSLPLNIICASSGEHALSLLLKHTFAAILLDVRMPGLSGYETASLIHQQEQFEAIPIIFVTGQDKDHAPYELLNDAEKISYIFKPVNAGELRDKLRSLLGL